MSRIDAWVQRLPGSVPFKSFVTACAICAIVAVPVFQKKPEESRQGHDYMSSEKPEIIRATQEQLRKEYRHQKRNAAIAAVNAPEAGTGESSTSSSVPVQDDKPRKA
jgi:hypothetical protein